MKTKILIAGLILGSMMAQAQSNEKTATVRIKKIENINGVEKVTDTTFTTTDPSTLTINGARVKMLNHDGKDGSRVIIVDDEINPDANMKVIRSSGDIDKEIEEALKEAGIDPANKGDKKVIIVRDENNKDANNGERKVTKIVMMKADMCNASESDRKRLNSQIGNSDDKLEVEKMSLYPNPGDGKFNLKFDLKNRADAEVTIYDTNGKQVYNEKLPAFSGEYNRPIDISQNSKGAYFVKVGQGKHSMVKKIVME